MSEANLKVIYHDLYLTDYPTASCETPERVVAIMEVLKRHYPIMKPPAAAEEDVLLVHSQQILRAVKSEPDVYSGSDRRRRRRDHGR
jgi:acetoin utilization deacetylase AcuC-like enzyme